MQWYNLKEIIFCNGGGPKMTLAVQVTCTKSEVSYHWIIVDFSIFFCLRSPIRFYLCLWAPFRFTKAPRLYFHWPSVHWTIVYSFSSISPGLIFGANFLFWKWAGFIYKLRAIFRNFPVRHVGKQVGFRGHKRTSNKLGQTLRKNPSATIISKIQAGWLTPRLANSKHQFFSRKGGVCFQKLIQTFCLWRQNKMSSKISINL